MFVDFLTTTAPFSTAFDVALAQDFYSSIRCGLLHEATTKNGWKIWAHGDVPIDPERRILFRNNFQATITQYVELYAQRLMTEPDIQSAFIRKFDTLAS